jgi:hypothetical protein
MESDIIITDNKEYYYVISYYRPSNDFIRSDLKNTDISIFEINEWEDLLDKSKTYKKWVNIFNSDYEHNYISIQPKVKSAVYYLYFNCPFCMYNDFTSLESCVGSSYDVYHKVFIETKNELLLSINKFREWIIFNDDEFIKNYDIIKTYENSE